jgi:hypothetical protein
MLRRLPAVFWAIVAGGALVAAAISVGSCGGDAQRLDGYVFAFIVVLASAATMSRAVGGRSNTRVAAAFGGALVGMVLVYVVLTLSFGINCAA